MRPNPTGSVKTSVKAEPTTLTLNTHVVGLDLGVGAVPQRPIDLAPGRNTCGKKVPEQQLHQKNRSEPLQEAGECQ